MPFLNTWLALHAEFLATGTPLPCNRGPTQGARLQDGGHHSGLSGPDLFRGLRILHASGLFHADKESDSEFDSANCSTTSGLRFQPQFFCHFVSHWVLSPIILTKQFQPHMMVRIHACFSYASMLSVCYITCVLCVAVWLESSGSTTLAYQLSEQRSKDSISCRTLVAA